MNELDLIASFISLNGGEMVGKTRFQKTVFLLDKCGLDSGFDFEYHNYGPFSADLAKFIEFSEAVGTISSKQKQGYHSVPYTVYSSKFEPPKKIGNLSSKKVEKLLNIMNEYSAIELELAATAAFLAAAQYDEDEIDNLLIQLKPMKSTKERLARSHQLLEKLGLE